MKTTTYLALIFCVMLLGMVSSSALAMVVMPPTQTVEWIQQAGTSGDDNAYDVVADGMGNIYITGWTEGELAGTGSHVGKEDVFLSKYNATGTCLWTQQLGSTESDQAYGLVLDGAGHVYIAGHTEGDLGGTTSNDHDNVFISMYDTDGNYCWTKQSETYYDDTVTGLAIDGSGNLYVTGYRGVSLLDYDAFLKKYDSTGNPIWTQSWGYPGTLGHFRIDAAMDVAIDHSNNVYITGVTQGSDDNSGDFFLIKYDDDGNLLWEKEAGTSSSDAGTGLTIDSSNNVYITGATAGNLSAINEGENDAIARKYNSNGQLLWAKQWGTEGIDTGLGVTVDNAGNLYIAGTTDSDLAGTNPSDNNDVFIRKYDNTGNLAWTEQIGVAGKDECWGLTVDNLGNLYFSGYTSGDLAGPGTHVGDQDLFLAKITEVPEPGTMVLVLMGVVTLGLIGRRKR
ncbi:MAG: SBBP repeat-containing protein [Planctomycetia bacterium]|jgi:hypothetical protein